jgi:Raf kinase inhibitor-like YbhB/YbcL family protein
MKKILIPLVIIFLSGCSVSKTQPITVFNSYQGTSTPPVVLNKTYMKLTSLSFDNGNEIPSDFTCQGKKNFPVLQIADEPASTTAFALIINDPDAPAGVFTHLLLWNFDLSTTTIDIKNLPKSAIIGLNSAGTAKYVPPCPPSGTHHYYFRLYALDQKLNLPAKSDEKSLVKAITGHIIDEAVLMGTVKSNK